MPMFAPAWKQSFGDISKNLKAMSACGWSVLNYALLDHPEVTKGMTLDNLKAEYLEVFGKFKGQDLPSNEDLQIQLSTCQNPTPGMVRTAYFPSQGEVGVSDLNFTGGMGQLVIDDIVTGNLAIQSRASVWKRAKLLDETSEAFKKSKALMLQHPTEGKLATHNCYRLKEDARDAVVRKEVIRNVEKHKSRVNSNQGKWFYKNKTIRMSFVYTSSYTRYQ